MPTPTVEWTCTGSEPLITCQYAASSSPPTYHDWMLVNTTEIFLLSFIAVGILFTFFRK